jgi:hypothetical protein
MVKRLILFLVVLISFSPAFGQKLNKTYFLLGTLHDYIGRKYNKNNPTQWSYIMTLHEKRMGQIKRIEEVTGNKFKRRNKRDDCPTCHEFYDLNSYFKARRINCFYKFKNTLEKDDWGFNFYSGQLICKKLNRASESKQLSFLAGLFLTCGAKEGDVYKIRLYNSSWRFECTLQLLKILGAEIIKEEKMEIAGMAPFSY